jgi:RNA polymerase sigma-70 factor (ECF subfamily)
MILALFCEASVRMDPAPITRPSLIVRLRDPKDADAWRQFTELYGPLIFGFARKRGLQDADAADLMQDVLRSVAGAAGRLDYDPKRGTFRGWLYTITRNKIFNFLDRRRHQVRGSGDSDVRDRLETTPDKASDDTDEWDRELELRLFHQSADEIKKEFRANTWDAFWKTAVEGQSSEEVGQALHMSVGAIYVAKSRVLARLREKVKELQDG